jgi:acyl dehydratase
MQAGMLGGFVSDWVGVENLREFEVRFMAPVHVGDVLDLTAEIMSVTEGLAAIRAAVHVGSRQVVAGTASALVAK